MRTISTAAPGPRNLTVRIFLVWLLLGSPFLGSSVEAQLAVASGATHELPAGDHRFDVVRLGRDATIELSGSTRLLTNQLITDGPSTLRYVGSDTSADSQRFDFVVVDGRGMRGTLLIEGSGKSRTQQQRVGESRRVQGGPGYDGLAGEDGMNIDLSLFQVNYGAHVELVTFGGDGGAGGLGGAGSTYTVYDEECVGMRGDPCAFVRSRAREVASRGGDGGRGGSGGASGQVRVFLVHQDGARESDVAALREFSRNNIRIASRGGRGGNGGRGGAGEGGAGRDGHHGSAGAAKTPTVEAIGAAAWMQKKAQSMARTDPHRLQERPSCKGCEARIVDVAGMRLWQIELASPVTWGEWSGVRHCDRDSYIDGLEQRIEPRQGTQRDDAGMVAIRFRCGRGTDEGEEWWVDLDGPHDVLQWGYWTGAAYCATGAHVVGLEQRSVPWLGDQHNMGRTDDVATTGVRFLCAGAGEMRELDSPLPKNAGWGTWTGKAECPAGTYLWGLEQRVERWQGEGSRSGADDAALSGIRFLCRGE